MEPAVHDFFHFCRFWKKNWKRPPLFLRQPNHSNGLKKGCQAGAWQPGSISSFSKLVHFQSLKAGSLPVLISSFSNRFSSPARCGPVSWAFLLNWLSTNWLSTWLTFYELTPYMIDFPRIDVLLDHARFRPSMVKDRRMLRGSPRSAWGLLAGAARGGCSSSLISENLEQPPSRFKK